MSVTVGMPLSMELGNDVQIAGPGISGPVMGIMGYNVAQIQGDGGGPAMAPQQQIKPTLDSFIKPTMG